MSRASIIVPGLLLCWLVVGCASQDRSEVPTTANERTQPAVARQALSASMLFDRRPGGYEASDFAVRSDWPSTISYYSPGQVVYSRERLIDVQGVNAGGFSYQKFDTERVTFGYR